MTIYIDADACPVTRIAEGIAKEHGIPVTLLCDTNHLLTSDYSTVRTIGAGADAVDLALINLCRRGDIVITQDYGVAALALGKGAKAIHQSGMRYTDDNIDRLLMERHLARKARQSGKHHLKGPAKRTEEDDRRFAESFEKLIRESEYVCRTATREEMERKWNAEIERNTEDRENWIVWKAMAVKNAEDGASIPYYGFLGEKIICEATAVLKPEYVQNGEGLADEHTAYLCAFRTNEAYRGQGYFSALMKFMLEDLRRKGYTKVTVGVEPEEETNRRIYDHWGFSDFIKSSRESYPDGTEIEVEYYGKRL